MPGRGIDFLGGRMWAPVRRWLTGKRRRAGTSKTSRRYDPAWKYFKRGYDRRNVGSYGYSTGVRELKFLDLNFNYVPPNVLGTIHHLGPTISQGTGPNNRIGRRVQLHSILVRGAVLLLTDTTDPSPFDRIRIMLVQDKQTNGALPTVAEVVDNPTIDGFNNVDNSLRFKVLYNKTFTLNSTSSYQDTSSSRMYPSPCTRSVNFNIKFKKRKPVISYGSTTGALSEMESNSFFFIVFSEQDTADFQGRLRWRFTD
jgi:hypothetical protein